MGNGREEEKKDKALRILIKISNFLRKFGIDMRVNFCVHSFGLEAGFVKLSVEVRQYDLKSVVR